MKLNSGDSQAHQFYVDYDGNGFSGTVSLTAIVSPTGPVASITPASLTIATGGSANANLTVSTGSAIPASYTVTVSGTSGTLSHSAKEPLTLSPTSTGPSIGNVPLTLLTDAFIAAVVLIGTTVYFMRRKTGKP